MYVTPHEIAQSRDHALNNLLGLSTACLEAGQRFSELFAGAGRDTLHAGSQHLNRFGHGQLDALSQFPTSFWLEHSIRSSKLLDQACEILGETHKVLIQSAEAQVRAFDEIVFASLNRAVKSSPWESEIALNALRTTLQTAENTLRGMSIAAVETVSIAENEVHQISETLAEQPVQKPKAPARSRSRAH